MTNGTRSIARGVQAARSVAREIVEPDTQARVRAGFFYGAGAMGVVGGLGFGGRPNRLLLLSGILSLLIGHRTRPYFTFEGTPTLGEDLPRTFPTR